MTYEPMEGVLVVATGIFPVDRYTWGMISSDLHGDEIPQMDVVIPSRGKKTSDICMRKKEGHHLGGTLTNLDPRGIFLFHMDIEI